MAAESLCKLKEKILKFGLCLRQSWSIYSGMMALDFSMISSFSGGLCRKSRLKTNTLEKILIYLVIPSSASFSRNNQRLAKANYSHYFPGSIIQRVPFAADMREQYYIWWKQFFSEAEVIMTSYCLLEKKTNVPCPEHTLRKNIIPSSSHHQLPVTPQLGEVLPHHLPLLTLPLSSLIFGRYGAFCHNCCDY